MMHFFKHYVSYYIIEIILYNVRLIHIIIMFFTVDIPAYSFSNPTVGVIMATASASGCNQVYYK